MLYYSKLTVHLAECAVKVVILVYMWLRASAVAILLWLYKCVALQVFCW